MLTARIAARCGERASKMMRKAGWVVGCLAERRGRANEGIRTAAAEGARVRTRARSRIQCTCFPLLGQL
ncbi:hypothetical protein EON67_07530 [archaeon]|nr:MAG: hypothetical protein EON67_07530 [archaeon]